jgi:hypothetical protein
VAKPGWPLECDPVGGAGGDSDAGELEGFAVLSRIENGGVLGRGRVLEADFNPDLGATVVLTT